jgi:hypothetical protein
MLRCILRPSITYDVVGLARDGLITVGRESESHIRLDSPDVPFLLSRRHATLQFQPDGNIVLRDLASTNGTYIGRQGQPLQKLGPNASWVVLTGDTIGFGGPETIVAHRMHVSNPFLFKYYSIEEEDDTEEQLPDAAERMAAGQRSGSLEGRDDLGRRTGRRTTDDQVRREGGCGGRV